MNKFKLDFDGIELKGEETKDGLTLSTDGYDLYLSKESAIILGLAIMNCVQVGDE